MQNLKTIALALLLTTSLFGSNHTEIDYDKILNYQVDAKKMQEYAKKVMKLNEKYNINLDSEMEYDSLPSGYKTELKKLNKKYHIDRFIDE